MRRGQGLVDMHERSRWSPLALLLQSKPSPAESRVPWNLRRTRLSELCSMRKRFHPGRLRNAARSVIEACTPSTKEVNSHGIHYWLLREAAPIRNPLPRLHILLISRSRLEVLARCSRLSDIYFCRSSTVAHPSHSLPCSQQTSGESCSTGVCSQRDNGSLQA